MSKDNNFRNTNSKLNIRKDNCQGLSHKRYWLKVNRAKLRKTRCN